MAALLSAVKTLSTMNDKPHSSISNWVDILSGPNYQEDDYEGIPELVDSINLQPTGPQEACRAVRKKLKYGDVHRQLRSLTMLKALVENCGQKFQSSLTNDPLIERIKTMAHDSMTDERVKKKLMSVLASWHRQFKDDPRMSTVAGLYASLGGGQRKPPPRPVVDNSKLEEQQRRAEQAARERLAAKQAEAKAREEAKLRAKAEKERARQPAKPVAKTKRKPFNFEEEKPKVLAAISTASQASNNLINALKLVNREKESIEENARVQECLAEAKGARKPIVRYVQLVENENFIGTLIDANERIISALQLYDYMLKPASQDSDEEGEHGDAERQEPQTTGASTTSDPELLKLQVKQRAAIERFTEQHRQGSFNQYGFAQPSGNDGMRGVYADLQDLSFNDSSRTNLPAPIRPNADAYDGYDSPPLRHGSLSDYSDYESSDEGHHRANHASSSSAAAYGNTGYSQYTSPGASGAHPSIQTGQLIDLDDPFADPGEEVSTPGITPRKQYVF